MRWPAGELVELVRRRAPRAKTTRRAKTQSPASETDVVSPLATYFFGGESMSIAERRHASTSGPALTTTDTETSEDSSEPGSTGMVWFGRVFLTNSVFGARLDGVEIAADWSDLIDGELAARRR